MDTLAELKKAEPWLLRYLELKHEFEFKNDILLKLTKRAELPGADVGFIQARLGPLQASIQETLNEINIILETSDQIESGPSPEEVLDLSKAVAALKKINVQSTTAVKLFTLLADTIKDD